MEREKHIEPQDVDIPELVPIELYNINQASVKSRVYI